MEIVKKRQDLEKRYYKEIKNGNYEKAEKIMKLIIDMDAKKKK